MHKVISRQPLPEAMRKAQQVAMIARRDDATSPFWGVNTPAPGRRAGETERFSDNGRPEHFVHEGAGRDGFVHGGGVLRMTQQVSRHPGIIDRDWLLARLDAVGMSQRQLSKRLHVDAASVSRLVNGRRHLTFEDAVDLARALVVPVREVIQHAGIDLDAPAVRLVDYSVDYGPQVIKTKPSGVL